MSDEGVPEGSSVNADDNSIAIGRISIGGNVGDIRIGHTIGYTSEQVSALIAQISTTFVPKPFDGRCPYKGLDFFEEEDAELFFGREKLVEGLVGRVKESRTVFITGPSGSGKSSLVRAGLVHALKQGGVKESRSENWLYTTMKPGREPINTLASAMAGLVMSTNAEDEIRAKAPTDETIFARWCEIALKDGRDKRVVLFIDQFEEVFTQISKEEERVAFLNMLTHAATVESGRVIILLAMRSDFVSNCAIYPKLNALLNQQFVQIGAMGADELVSAIAQPALRVGLRIDPDLIAQIINDMEGEPGSLPLMQFALKDLFNSQQEKGGLIALTLNDYLQRGGIHKSLERHADKTFASFSPEEQELARSIFSGLIEIGRGTQDTRRTAIFEELVPANMQSANVEAIVRKLADARLITTDEVAGKDTVTISHEKLIEAWPWLKKLVNENRDVIALQNEIAEDAKEWEEHKQDTSYLYTGARLANAHEQLEAKKLGLSGLAQLFIEASVKAHSDELEAANRRAAQLRRLARNLTVALIAALIAVGAAIFFGSQSLHQTQLATSRQLAAQAISEMDGNYDLAALLSVAAFKQEDTAEARTALLFGLQRHSNLIGYLQGYHSPIVALVFNPKQNMLASASKDGQIILWDVNKQTALPESLTVDRSISSLSFSSDGQVLVAELTASPEAETQWKQWSLTRSQAPRNHRYNTVVVYRSMPAKCVQVSAKSNLQFGGESQWKNPG